MNLSRFRASRKWVDGAYVYPGGLTVDQLDYDGERMELDEAEEELYRLAQCGMIPTIDGTDATTWEDPE